MRRRPRAWLVGLVTAALVIAANASQGAYFSQSWGWVALGPLCAIAFALILGWAQAPGLLRMAFAALLTALGVWVALSSFWSVSSPASLREAERMLVYVAVAAALALVLRRGDAAALAAGLFVTVVAVSGYALATHLFQDTFEAYDDPNLPYRLSEPIGYWNSLGLLAAMGLLVGLGMVAQGRRLSLSVLAGLPLPILATTLYFTFSRGAWAALALAFAALVAVDPRRLQLLTSFLVVLPASALAVAVASQQKALTTESAIRADAVSEGRGLALVVLALAVGSGALALGGWWLTRRVPVTRWVRRGVDAVLAAAAVGAVAVAVSVAGGPHGAWEEIEKRFDGPIGGTADLNDRLFDVSGNGRAESIRVAWDAALEHPLAGNGAGSYEYVWYEERPSLEVIRDAHSLYTEMFAELGVVGVAILGLALLVPVVAGLRARRQRMIPGAVAAYVAWVVHSAMDWHWEIVGVTVTALLAGGVALLAAERHRPATVSQLARPPLLVATTAATLFALVSLVGNQALFAGREALARDKWATAAEHARRAEKLLPWSFEPDVVLGDAAAGAGDRRRALESYRDAAAADPQNWTVWLRLAQVARGKERARAYGRVHVLNPRETDLPGEQP